MIGLPTPSLRIYLQSILTPYTLQKAYIITIQILGEHMILTQQLLKVCYILVVQLCIVATLHIVRDL